MPRLVPVWSGLTMWRTKCWVRVMHEDEVCVAPWIFILNVTCSIIITIEIHKQTSQQPTPPHLIFVSAPLHFIPFQLTKHILYQLVKANSKMAAVPFPSRSTSVSRCRRDEVEHFSGQVPKSPVSTVQEVNQLPHIVSVEVEAVQNTEEELQEEEGECGCALWYAFQIHHKHRTNKYNHKN